MSRTIRKIKNTGVVNAKKTNKPTYIPDWDDKAVDISHYKAESNDFLPSHTFNDWRETEEVRYK
ncbi:hypothetical protein [Crenothrix sp.]|uniref:hypothetical protein n=1 Tax=Crenothrix sp. TaxID=3100433 RepID=UPI00374DD0C3